MRPATGTLRIPAIDPRQALAAFLLARHEARVAEGMTPQLLQWGEMQILAGSNAPHSGDCSNENSSCPRCAYEAALRDAGAILALISGSNVTIDPEAATAPELRKLRKLVDGRR